MSIKEFKHYTKRPAIGPEPEAAWGPNTRENILKKNPHYKMLKTDFSVKQKFKLISLYTEFFLFFRTRVANLPASTILSPTVTLAPSTSCSKLNK